MDNLLAEHLQEKEKSVVTPEGQKAESQKIELP
jgi:hypothetical protein